MPTLTELKAENRRLKSMQDSLKDMQKIQDERVMLAKENQKIKRDLRYGKVIKTGKDIGNTLGKGAYKTGKGVFTVLKRYGDFLNAQEAKQKAYQRKLKMTKRLSMKKKNKSKKMKRKY